MKTFDTTTVGDVMHKGVVTCDVDEPLTSVARTMLQRRIHCVVVCTNRPPRPIPRSGASSPTSTS